MGLVRRRDVGRLQPLARCRQKESDRLNSLLPKRSVSLAFTANPQVQLIGMESCCVSHFPGRALRKQGHEVRLMLAQYVNPYEQTNKIDFLDAEAISVQQNRTSDGDRGSNVAILLSSTSRLSLVLPMLSSRHFSPKSMRKTDLPQKFRS
jgi:transposase